MHVVVSRGTDASTCLHRFVQHQPRHAPNGAAVGLRRHATRRRTRAWGMSWSRPAAAGRIQNIGYSLLGTVNLSPSLAASHVSALTAAGIAPPPATATRRCLLVPGRAAAAAAAAAAGLWRRDVAEYMAADHRGR